MVFSSLSFLLLFLPLVVLVYYIVPRRARNVTLLVTSLLFYAWGGGVFVLILAASVGVDYWAALLVARGVALQRVGQKALGIFLSVAVNLSLLGYFKYANFVAEQLNVLGAWLGLGTIAWTSVALPIGISFFTFQSMSYTLDVARGRSQALRNPIDFALFVSLFPQLVAGPIVRYHELASQLRDRAARLDDVADGVVRFSHGLVKKVVIADTLAPIVDAAFATPAADLTATTAWLGVLAFGLQLYFDFSGYSDMAIGLGRMFGFQFPENFRRPLSAVSVTDLWQRWHITLTRWLRDYYVPFAFGERRELGRGQSFHRYQSLLVLFLIVGFWHGASWTFLLWGAYWGIALIIEKILGQGVAEEANLVPLRRAALLLLFFGSLPLFRGESLAQAAAFYHVMASFVEGGLGLAASVVLTRQAELMLAVASASLLLPRSFVTGVVASTGTGFVPAVARILILGVGLPYSIILAASRTYQPFLYFQF